MEEVRRLIPQLLRMGTDTVLISGGEPLQHGSWAEMAAALREAGFKLWLLTAGMSLLKQADEAARLFETITVSLDGADRETYRAIRGVDSFRQVCEGVRAVVARGVAVSLRCTVQKRNYLQLPAIVSLAVSLGVKQLSFLAVDAHTNDAFGRGSGLLPPRSTPAPSPYPSTPGSGYPGSGLSRFGADFWGNKLCNNSEWLGWMTPSSSCSRYSTGDGTSSVFPTSVIESMVFYQLADRAGHPIAKTYIEALKNWPSDYSNGSDTKGQSAPDVLAKAKAQRWLAPFEFYAAETRYRGETPSGPRS